MAPHPIRAWLVLAIALLTLASGARSAERQTEISPEESSQAGVEQETLKAMLEEGDLDEAIAYLEDGLDELVREGAPQELLDELSARIAAVKRSRNPATAAPSGRPQATAPPAPHPLPVAKTATPAKGPHPARAAIPRMPKAPVKAPPPKMAAHTVNATAAASPATAPVVYMPIVPNPGDEFDLDAACRVPIAAQ